MATVSDASKLRKNSNVPPGTSSLRTTTSIPTGEITNSTNIVIKRNGEQFIESYRERSDLRQSDLEYVRGGSNPGLVLIFNQENFDDGPPRRRGSRRDVNEITICMGRLGLSVNPNHIYTDLTTNEILEAIDGIISLEPLVEINSLIVFFLTHGTNFNLLHSKDSTLQASDIWNKFANCKYLKDKPKLFIFQACKGDYHSKILTDRPASPISHSLVPDQTFEANHLGPDMLIAFATTENNVSFRHTSQGSWFIQELCRNFMSYGRRDDVVSLMFRITKCVCRNYFTMKSDMIQKQMPVFISTLRKKFYLNRSKDRSMLLHCLAEQDKIKDHLKEIDEKINEIIRFRESEQND